MLIQTYNTNNYTASTVLLNSIQNVQECDATDADSSNAAGPIKKYYLFYSYTCKALAAILIVCVTGLKLMAQPPYPIAALPAGNINTIEYFFDSKREFGSGIALLGFTPAVNINAFNGSVDLTGVSPGFHRIYFRSKDADGKWSFSNYAFFDNYNLPLYPAAPATPGNITQIEYSIDNNPAFGSGIQIPFTAGTNIAGLNTNINITGLAAGVHRFYIRSKDVNGKWSITNLSVFDNSSVAQYPTAPEAAPSIANMEYYIDTDPGFGNATPITVPGNTGDINNYSVNISLSGSLTIGTHFLYIRSRQNPWAVTNVVPFSASGVVPVSWLFFKAQIMNNETQLSWATALENNTGSFEIEHSIDGQNFSKVGVLPAAGYSSSLKNYRFLHTQPSPGFNYYRLKQIDRDGNFNYSAIATVLKKETLNKTIIAPNPVGDMLHIIEPAQTILYMAQVYNTAGELLWSTGFNSNSQVRSLPVSKLTAGVYYLRLQYKNEVKNFLFVKR